MLGLSWIVLTSFSTLAFGGCCGVATDYLAVVDNLFLEFVDSPQSGVDLVTSDWVWFLLFPAHPVMSQLVLSGAD